MKTQVFLGQREGAWKLIYIDDGITKPGFYFENAGDPKTHSPASRDVIFHFLEGCAALRARVQELEAEAKEPIRLLKQYISNFDDNEIENDELKSWLDNYWIPSVRGYLDGKQ